MGRSDCLGSPAATSAVALYAPVGLLWATGQALPWCPLKLSPHAIPATPEGLRSPDSGGGHPSTGLPPRTTESTPSLSSRGYPWVRCTLRPARLRTSVGRARQGTRCLGLPLAPPSNYPGALPAPGAGLPPASSRVSTAYCPVPFVGSSPKPVSGQAFLCRPAGIGPGFRTGSDQGGYHYRRWRGGIR